MHRGESAGSSTPWKHAAPAELCPRCAPTSPGRVPAGFAPLRRARASCCCPRNSQPPAPTRPACGRCGRMLDDIQLVGISLKVSAETGARSSTANRPSPSPRPMARREVGVVADHGAFHRAGTAGLLHLLRKQMSGTITLSARSVSAASWARPHGLSSTSGSCGWRSVSAGRAGSGVRCAVGRFGST